MAEFGLKEPFFIDEGELDGVPPHEAFVLGVEWQMIHTWLTDEPESEGHIIHTANKERLLKLAIRNKIPVHIEPCSTDPTWCYMMRGPKPKAQ